MDSGVSHDLVQQNVLGEAIDSGPVAIFVADEHRRYLAVNEYACALLGYTRPELLALTVTEVAVNVDAPDDYDEMVRSGSRSGTTILRHKDGRELAMSFRAAEATVGGLPVYVGVCWPVEG
jgi:PAS domain S-box-containing protein